jgi:hypothetical protein
MIFKIRSSRKQVSSLLSILLAALLISACSAPPFINLMTWEEYQELRLQGPYVLEMKHDKGALLYYGVMHTTAPEDPQLADIERRWGTFQPDLAFTEGGDWPLEKTREEAIRRGGEQGLLRFLAERNGVRTQNIDPPSDAQLRYLLKHYPGAQVKVYYILLHTVLMRTREQEPPNINLVNKILRDLSQGTWGYSGPPRKLKQFEEYIDKYLPEVEDWRNIKPSFFFSSDPDNFVAAMHRTLNRFRDEVMLGKIVKSVKMGKRVFALVGRAHVVMQEPALRTGLQPEPSD